MTELPNHIERQREQFVNEVRNEFGDAVDWIDAGADGPSVGLEHLREEGAEYFEQNPLEVEMGGSTEGLSLAEVDEFDEAVNAFAAEEGVAVNITGGGADTFVYTFYLHNEFLTVEP